MPMAINRYTTVEASISPDPGVIIVSSDHFSEVVRISMDETGCVAGDQIPGWSKYLVGVVNEFVKRVGPIPPLQIHVRSDVPIGAGLSSSASLEVAFAVLLQKVTGRPLTGIETARLCQAAENNGVGVPCGLMDPIASAMGRSGHLMLLDCQSSNVEYIEWPEEVSIIVTHSHVKHALADGEYQQRREQCKAACQSLGVESLREVDLQKLLRHQYRMSHVEFRRAHHVITENARTLDTARLIRQRDWPIIGEKLYKSHESLRVDYEVTCEETDLLVELAQKAGIASGVYGARMTGGGFGGCTITLVDTECAEAVAQSLVREYHRRTGATIDSFVAQPADGAIPIRQTAE